MSSDQVTHHKSIPVTNPARTIVDLRRTIPPWLLRRAIREAEAIGLDTGESVERSYTRSELEHRFLRLCRRHRIPPPEPNIQIGAFTVDFLWSDHMLVAETDGYRYHRGAIAFEQDRARDVELRVLGYEVVRFTYRQVTMNQRASRLPCVRFFADVEPGRDTKFGEATWSRYARQRRLGFHHHDGDLRFVGKVGTGPRGAASLPSWAS
ncbi:MAG: endonuclease domain-containing protein [Solirubrobacterales bacterium]